MFRVEGLGFCVQGSCLMIHFVVRGSPLFRVPRTGLKLPAVHKLSTAYAFAKLAGVPVDAGSVWAAEGKTMAGTNSAGPSGNGKETDGKHATSAALGHPLMYHNLVAFLPAKSMLPFATLSPKTRNTRQEKLAPKTPFTLERKEP